MAKKPRSGKEERSEQPHCSYSQLFSNNALQIRFLGDPQAEFTNALDLAFDATAIFGQPRSKRYALVIENGKIKEAYVEPDNTGVNGKCYTKYFISHMLMMFEVSAADKVLS